MPRKIRIIWPSRLNYRFEEEQMSLMLCSMEIWAIGKSSSSLTWVQILRTIAILPSAISLHPQGLLTNVTQTSFIFSTRFLLLIPKLEYFLSLHKLSYILIIWFCIQSVVLISTNHLSLFFSSSELLLDLMQNWKLESSCLMKSLIGNMWTIASIK